MKRIIAITLILVFASVQIYTPQAMAIGVSAAPAVVNLPAVGAKVPVSASYQPASLLGLKLFPQQPFRFDFILQTGQSGFDSFTIQEEALRLIRYFYASLTVPENEMWVNLSPHEQNRIVPESFGMTEMGRDLLAQDYILKQLTASLMYPDDETGKIFWERIYSEVFEKFGVTDVPMDTFNKVWIVPQKAVVYAEGEHVYVIDSRLSVMLDEDYAAQHKEVSLRGAAGDEAISEIASQKTLAMTETKDIIREIIVPVIEKEVNEGENFAVLRQVYRSLILAQWFKINLKNSIEARVYIDQNKIQGIDLAEKDIKQKIYNQYLESFKQGAYDLIKDEYDPVSQSVIPRRYFSGGMNMRIGAVEGTNNRAMLQKVLEQPEAGSLMVVESKVEEEVAVADSYRGNGALGSKVVEENLYRTVQASTEAKKIVSDFYRSFAIYLAAMPLFLCLFLDTKIGFAGISAMMVYGTLVGFSLDSFLESFAAYKRLLREKSVFDASTYSIFGKGWAEMWILALPFITIGVFVIEPLVVPYVLGFLVLLLPNPFVREKSKRVLRAGVSKESPVIDWDLPFFAYFVNKWQQESMERDTSRRRILAEQRAGELRIIERKKEILRGRPFVNKLSPEKIKSLLGRGVIGSAIAENNLPSENQLALEVSLQHLLTLLEDGEQGGFLISGISAEERKNIRKVLKVWLKNIHNGHQKTVVTIPKKESWIEGGKEFASVFAQRIDNRFSAPTLFLIQGFLEKSIERTLENISDDALENLPVVNRVLDKFFRHYNQFHQTSYSFQITPEEALREAGSTGNWKRLIRRKIKDLQMANGKKSALSRSLGKYFDQQIAVEHLKTHENLSLMQALLGAAHAASGGVDIKILSGVSTRSLESLAEFHHVLDETGSPVVEKSQAQQAAGVVLLNALQKEVSHQVNVLESDAGRVKNLNLSDAQDWQTYIGIQMRWFPWQGQALKQLKENSESVLKHLEWTPISENGSAIASFESVVEGYPVVYAYDVTEQKLMTFHEMRERLIFQHYLNFSRYSFDQASGLLIVDRRMDVMTHDFDTLSLNEFTQKHFSGRNAVQVDHSADQTYLFQAFENSYHPRVYLEKENGQGSVVMKFNDSIEGEEVEQGWAFVHPETGLAFIIYEETFEQAKAEITEDVFEQIASDKNFQKTRDIIKGLFEKFFQPSPENVSVYLQEVKTLSQQARTFFNELNEYMQNGEDITPSEMILLQTLFGSSHEAFNLNEFDHLENVFPSKNGTLQLDRDQARRLQNVVIRMYFLTQLIEGRAPLAIKEVNGQKVLDVADPLTLSNDYIWMADRNMKETRRKALVKDLIENYFLANPWKNVSLVAAEKKEVGGIDLNPSQIKLEQRGEGITIDVNQNFKFNMDINRIAPVILRVQPVTSAQLLSRLATEPTPVEYIKSAQIRP